MTRARRAALGRGRHLEAGLAAVEDGVVLVQGDGTIRIANHAARRLLADGEQLRGCIWQLLGIEAHDLETAATMETMVGPSNHPVELRSVGAAVDAVGGSEGSERVVVLRDLTTLAQAAKRQQRTLSTFSHEIRTPLASISAALDLLLDGFVGELSERQRHYLDMAARARDGLMRLVDQILDLELYARGAIGHDVDSVDFAAIVSGVVDRFRAAASERGLSFACQVTTTGMLRADPHRVEQVVTNLVSNAVKYADRDSTIVVRLGSTDLGDGWQILSVGSIGQPIPNEEVDLIFGDAHRVRVTAPIDDGGSSLAPVPRVRGSGLGLSISRAVVEAHGGALLVETLQREATFWVTLPTAGVALTTARHGDVGPFWICARGDGFTVERPDELVVATSLARAGLWVRLSPGEAQDLARAREQIATGIVVGTGETPPAASELVIPADRAAQVSQALALLVGHRGQQVRLVVDDAARLATFLQILGIRCGVSHDGWSSDAAAPWAALIELGAHVAAGDHSLAPVQRLIRRVAASEASRGDGPLAFGVVRLTHLDAFRLAYGAAEAASLRQDLRRTLRRILAAYGIDVAKELVELPEASLFSAPRERVRLALEELEQAFAAVGRLHIRRADIERGHFLIGGEPQPLVDVLYRLLPTDSQDEVLDALRGA